jgi:hypothetical protein
MRVNPDGAAMGKDRLGPIIVALAFIVLLGFIFFVTMREMSTTDDFLKVWAAVGPIVGVVTGLIPTYFFHNMAAEASKRAELHANHAGAMRGKLESMGVPSGEIPGL